MILTEDVDTTHGHDNGQQDIGEVEQYPESLVTHRESDIPWRHIAKLFGLVFDRLNLPQIIS